MRRYIALVLGFGLLTAGCASTAPISANPVQDAKAALGAANLGAAVLPAPLSIEDGLKEAAFNLDSAVTVGALPKDDPAPGCVHGVMRDLGLEPDQSPAPAFVPKTLTVLGKGAAAYIRFRQAQAMNAQGITVPTDCKAMIGSFILDAGRANAKLLPGGGLLPGLR